MYYFQIIIYLYIGNMYNIIIKYFFGDKNNYIYF